VPRIRGYHVVQSVVNPVCFITAQSALLPPSLLYYRPVFLTRFAGHSDPVTLGDLTMHTNTTLPIQYDNHASGTVCVLREVHGELVALAIPQNQYREWVGCFSIIN
jgi:hypothetical protein